MPTIPTPADVQVLVAVADPEVLSEIAAYLMTMQSDGTLNTFLDVPNEASDFPKGSPFWEQVRAAPLCRKFLLWGSNSERVLEIFFKALQAEFGSRLRVWHPHSSSSTLSVNIE